MASSRGKAVVEAVSEYRSLHSHNLFIHHLHVCLAQLIITTTRIVVCKTLHLIIARIVTPFICGAVVAPNWARLLGRKILGLLSCGAAKRGSSGPGS